MQCPNCHRENDPANRYCAFCGSPLNASEAGSLSEIPFSQQLQSIHNEVRHLSESLADINNRLAALESGAPVTSPQPAPAPQPEAVPSEPFVPGEEAIPGETFKAIAEVIRPAKPREWEQILGGNWLARIGVIALIMGVSFLLKFAADNKWLNPTGWDILGIIGGLVILGAGHYWHKRYPAFAQALSGGGIALLYISTFAAFFVLHLISFYPGVFFLVLVSTGSAALAIKYNSMALAILGIFGAFIVPFILTGLARKGAMLAQAGPGIQILAYIMVIDLGVLALSTLRNWRWFTLLALFGSLSAFGVWHDGFGARAGLLVSEISLTIIFLIFVGAMMLYHLIWRRLAAGVDYTLMVINAGAYFAISSAMMWRDLRPWMGGFAFILALFYGGLAYATLKRGRENKRLSLFALGIAIIFLTIAIPVQLGNTAWTTVAWGSQMVVLMWLSFAARLSQLRRYCYGVLIVTAGRLFFLDTPVRLRAFQPILNERFLAFAVAIAAMYLVAYILWRHKKDLTGWRVPFGTFVIAANFFSLWLFSFEAWNYFDSLRLSGQYFGEAARALRSAQLLSLTAIWAFYAASGLVVGISKRWRPLRLGALILLAIAILKAFFYDVFTLEMIYRIIAFVGLGLLLLASAYLYQRYSKVIKGFLTK